jgi:hypothetical protein
MQNRYQNVVTGIYSGSPTPLNGGLLADVCQMTDLVYRITELLNLIRIWAWERH